MHQLYNVVAVPKMAYVAGVWYMPVFRPEGKSRHSRSVGVTRRLTTLQRLTTTTITGALRTTATDVLELHANMLPVNLLLHQICHRAAVCLATLPLAHLLAPLFRLHAKRHIKTHRSSLHELAYIFGIAPDKVEKLPPARVSPQQP